MAPILDASVRASPVIQIHHPHNFINEPGLEVQVTPPAMRQSVADINARLREGDKAIGYGGTCSRQRTRNARPGRPTKALYSPEALSLSCVLALSGRNL